MNSSLILTLLKKFSGIVIIDEAYVDFSTAGSWIDALPEYPNLVVLQTFSKAWGLANLRLGMLFADKEIISVLDTIKYPYNLSGITQKLVLDALQFQTSRDKMIADILQQRSFLQTELEKLNLVKKVYPSEANFLLVQVKDAAFVHKKLIDKKIIVRNRSNLPHCKNCLRITVGTAKENNDLITALKSFEG